MRKRKEPVTFEYDFEKALAALVYLASQPDKVTKFDKKKALSLLFLADKAHLVRYGEPIFGDFYKALPYGVVPQKTLDRLDNFVERPGQGRDIERLAEALEIVNVPDHDFPVFRAKVAPNLDVLSELELKALDTVIKLHGKKRFEQLKGPVHPRAWEKAWKTKPPQKNAAPIPYEDFFEDDPNAIDGALERMIEDFELRRALSGR